MRDTDRGFCGRPSLMNRLPSINKSTLPSDLDNNWIDRFDVTYLAAMVNFQVMAEVATIGLEATSFVQKQLRTRKYVLLYNGSSF